MCKKEHIVMYDTGLGEQDFENRLHQLPTGANDLAQFKVEFDTLIGSALPSISGRWVKEGKKKDTQHYTTYWELYHPTHNPPVYNIITGAP